MSTAAVVAVVLVVVLIGFVPARRGLARRLTRRTGTWVGKSTP